MWLLEKVGLSVDGLTAPGDGGREGRAHPNLLTPETIPAFFIPPLLPAGRDRVRGPGLAQAASLHVIQVEADSEGEDGASRVPLHANPAEILRLPESPHTRRKESLFHARGPPGAAPSPRLEAGNWARWSAQSLRPRLGQGASTDSDAASSSAESTPRSSPAAARGKGQVSRAGSLSADDCSSADSSPGASRRPDWIGAGWAASAWLALPPTPLYPPDFARRQQPLTKETTVALDKGGTLRLSAEYLVDGQRLRVRLGSVEGLYPASFPPGAVSCFVTVYLLPGKGQKQRSTIIRRSRNPIFNEDFFFEQVTQEDIASKAMKVKVVNKGAGMRRNCVMGESRLGLAAILPSLHTLNRG
ncbi:C2 calcium-dependent domain-containing protein 4C-like [Scyliorhinus torazame]|uniref:C2 calcium-dependent domain-containing protein 4C-like n=1 Tax=Scyliorhinus torazame TaxID=75743 RepID=UPI003B5975FA